MKKISLISIATVCFVGLATGFIGADETLQTTVNASVDEVFSLEFYNDANVLYSTTVPFSNVETTTEYNYADGRAEDDGKSDVGLLVTTNRGNPWFLKIGVNGSSELLGKLGYYMGQPWNRNWDSPADGSLGHGDWFNVPATTNPETMYTAGTGDQTNTPFGTLATISFKIDGSGLTPGAKNVTVTYTLTETP